MPITGLGHTGLWVTDLGKMRDFYERVIGLTVTDEDEEQGIVFLSSRPRVEHHEFVLQRGRTAPPGSLLPHQVSWRVDSVETLQMYHHRFKAEGVPVQQEVTHGNAFGIYFFDPEGNRGEVYLRIPRDVRQPFRKTLNLEQPVAEVNAEAERLLAADGPRYQPVAWAGAAKRDLLCVPGDGRARPVGQLGEFAFVPYVARRCHEACVRLQPELDPVLLDHPGGGMLAHGVVKFALGHQGADPQGEVDDGIEVGVHGGVDERVAEHRQVGRWPVLVQDAQRNLGVALDGLRLGTCAHRRDQDVIAVHQVVEGRHGRAVVVPAVREDGRPVVAHELPALRTRQLAFLECGHACYLLEG
jgi:catechol 2,3-dioxygenase-like lactoylglutathione lyase family enzyme